MLYQPTSPKIATAILSRLELDYPQYTFIDFGSGKGRVLLIASGFPFKAVIGVEFAEELHRVASRERASKYTVEPRCGAVRSGASLKMLPILYHQSHLLVLFFSIRLQNQLC